MTPVILEQGDAAHERRREGHVQEAMMMRKEQRRDRDVNQEEDDRRALGAAGTGDEHRHRDPVQQDLRPGQRFEGGRRLGPRAQQVAEHQPADDVVREDRDADEVQAPRGQRHAHGQRRHRGRGEHGRAGQPAQGDHPAEAVDELLLDHRPAPPLGGGPGGFGLRRHRLLRGTAPTAGRSRRRRACAPSTRAVRVSPACRRTGRPAATAHRGRDP